MKNIRVTLPDGGVREATVGTVINAFIPEIGPNSGVTAVLANNQIKALNDRIYEDTTLELLDIRDPAGLRVYQRSAAFLMVYAAHKILGNSVKIMVKHSINKNLYYEARDENGVNPLTHDIIHEIEAVMTEAVDRDLRIERLTISMPEGCAILSEMRNTAMLQSLEYHKSNHIRLYRLGDYHDYFYGPVVPSAGYIRRFKLAPDRSGFFLQLPKTDGSEELLEIKDVRKVRKVFDEAAHWARIIGIDTVGVLNAGICEQKGGDIVRVNEALHEKRLAAIADDIYNQKKTVVLIAGPSSSGKTTFANRLCVQLRVLGMRPHIISLDNYFLNRVNAPLDAFGKPDLESFDFLDKEQLQSDLAALLDGGIVQLPSYNFQAGEREYKGHYVKLEDRDVLVIEGIHGLNEALTNNVPKTDKYKIFISLFTQISVDHHNRIPTSDARLLRRIVRDMRTRGYGAASTLTIWDSVTRGEAANIFPFQEDVDAIFNSALVYELCVLKQYVEPPLFGIKADNRCYADARRLLSFLDCFVSMPPEEVPNNSILREFIGGSVFHV